jgi:hypothetical protein
VWRPTGGGQPYPGNEGRSDRGRVGGEEGGVFLPGSGHFPGAFKVMRPWLSRGKKYVSETPVKVPACALGLLKGFRMGYPGARSSAISVLSGYNFQPYRGIWRDHRQRIDQQTDYLPQPA